uniref:Uncharacterized protein n=1 Tax=Ananas comosus var. bracteatus TaxID=296719 RepID=A0A6V7NWY3_ANACO|nr:unnamed protein product [Ananas comosus var. bracteatus]
MRFQCDEIAVSVWTVLVLATLVGGVQRSWIQSCWTFLLGRPLPRGTVRCSLERRDGRIAVPKEVSPPATLEVMYGGTGVSQSLERFSPPTTLGMVYKVASTNGTGVAQSLVSLGQSVAFSYLQIASVEPASAAAAVAFSDHGKGVAS